MQSEELDINFFIILLKERLVLKKDKEYNEPKMKRDLLSGSGQTPRT